MNNLSCLSRIGIFIATLVFFVPTFGNEESHSTSIFFKNLKKIESFDKRKILIEKRIDFALKNDTRINTKRDIEYYLEMDIPDKEKSQFFDSLLTTYRNNSLSMVRWTEACQDIRCLVLLGEKLTELEIGKYPVLSKNILIVLSPINLDYFMKNKVRVNKAFERYLNMAESEKLQSDLIFNAKYLGFYQSGLDFLNKNPKIKESNPWIRLDYCVLNYLLGNFEEAKRCLGAGDGPIFEIHQMYLNSVVLKNETVDRRKFSAIKKKILSLSDESSKNKALIFEILIFNSLEKVKLTEYNVSAFSSNYLLGFTLLSLLMKIEKNRSKWHQTLYHHYVENFSGSFLVKVLKGNQSGREIIKHFGESATISKAVHVGGK